MFIKLKACNKYNILLIERYLIHNLIYSFQIVYS